MYPLAEGEQLLWSGRPQRFVRRYRDYHGYVVSVVAFQALIAIGVLGVAKFEVDLAIFALVPGFFGMLIGLSAERNRQRKLLLGVLTYLVTDRRLIFVADRPGGIEFRWIWHPDLREPRVRDHGDGTGTVDFRPTLREWLRDQQYRAQSSLSMMLPELLAIEDAEHVAELIVRNAPRSPVVG
ncbi:hypothetical protein [Amycolatopsis sp. VC5-11]|uniref:hypothetical protein n=1 Tax=Amycolatopsis sp. VC5-11 TaxID=3120156 RepID=UPI00056922C3